MPTHPVRWQWIVAFMLLPIPTALSYSDDALDCYRAYSNEAWSDAGRACQAAALSGDAESQFKLATLLARGQGATRDLGEAARWLEAASLQGHLEANYNLGVAFEQGNGVPRDAVRAAALYRTSASDGHAKSQRDLAYLYERGEGVDADLHKAFLWHRQSAEAGLVSGELKTGLMLIEGNGTEPDRDAGLLWLRRAGEHGDADAQFVLGVLLQEDDPGAAQQWLARAADQNQMLALHQFAARLAVRDDVSSLQRARQYADRAVRAGHLDSVALVQELDNRVRVAAPGTQLAEPTSADAVADPAPRFTIQLIALSSESKVLKFLGDYQLGQAAHYYQTVRNDTILYRVTYGEYRQRQEAEAMIQRLPPELRRLKPMVKSLQRLQMSSR